MCAKSHCQISGLGLNWHRSRTFAPQIKFRWVLNDLGSWPKDVWVPDQVEMGPEWFRILAQSKTGPRQKWDILSKLERDYVNNSKWRQLAISRTKNQKITRSKCAKFSGPEVTWVSIFNCLWLFCGHQSSFLATKFHCLALIIVCCKILTKWFYLWLWYPWLSIKSISNGV